jgi:hypothetical protein
MHTHAHTDRDSKRFRALLNFMRTRAVILDDGVSIEGFIQEAEYFHVQEAVRAAQNMRGPEERQQLLKCVVDARRGKLLSLNPRTAGYLPCGEPILVSCYGTGL